MINNELRPIDRAVQKEFNDSVGNPEQMKKDLEISKIAIETFERHFTKYCIVIGFTVAFPSPITFVVGLYVLKQIFGQFSAVSKTRTLPGLIKNAFVKALTYHQELSVPFFKKYGHLFETASLEFPPNMVATIDFKEYKEWLLTKIRSKKVLELIEANYKDVEKKQLILQNTRIFSKICRLDCKAFHLEEPLENESSAAKLSKQQELDRMDFEPTIKSENILVDENNSKKFLFIKLSNLVEIVKACTSLRFPPFLEGKSSSVYVMETLHGTAKEDKEAKDSYFRSI